MAKNKVFLAKGVSALKPDERPRYRLFADCGIGVNLIGDRHRRGRPFPASFEEDGWIDEGSSSDFKAMALALDEMQEYFDEHFGEGAKKEKPKKVQCVADKKSHSGGIRRASRPVKRKV